MKLGIVGLPNVGKSTLFNALTASAQAAAANYPFCTVDPNIGSVPVPDARLDFLTKMFEPLKVTPAVCEFVDIAGLVRGASKGEGLGSRFLSHVRETDAILHVLRCFDDPNVTHVEGAAGPSRDAEIVSLELTLSDLEMVDRRIEKTKKLLKGDRSYAAELDFWESVRQWLDGGKPAREYAADAAQKEWLDSAPLMSAKPVIYVANMDEQGFVNRNDNEYFREVLQISPNALPVCAKLEADLAGLEQDERALFLSELGVEESGLERLIRASYHLLGCISFLTAGKPEVRAWTITEGTKAPQAAGKIHTDFERGFIRAEVVAFDTLADCGSMPAAKEKGLVRSEGKEYVVRDGDVVLFRFNV